MNKFYLKISENFEYIDIQKFTTSKIEFKSWLDMLIFAKDFIEVLSKEQKELGEKMIEQKASFKLVSDTKMKIIELKPEDIFNLFAEIQKEIDKNEID